MTISTVGMSREDWLKERGIGSSDIPVIMGLIEQTTPLMLYRRKKGEIPDVEETDEMHWGSTLEDFVVARFKEKYPDVKVRKDNKIRVHPTLGWARCNLDRVISEPGEPTTGVLELKTTTSHVMRTWGADVSPSYVMQLQWQFFVTGKEWGYLVVAVLDTRKLVVFKMRRNEELIKQAVTAAKVFHEALTLGQPVLLGMTVVDLDGVTVNAGTEIEATPEILGMVENYRRMYADYKGIEREVDAIKNEIKLFVGENQFLTSEGAVLATYRSYQKQGFTVEPKTVRSLTIKKIKGDE